MMGRQDRDQRQLFYEFSLDEMIPTDHLLLRAEGFAVDASVMEANASRYHGKAPDELDWTDAQRQKRAVAEYLAGLETEAQIREGEDGRDGGSDGKPTAEPDRKSPKVISPSDPSSAWTAKANKRVQFGYGLNYLIDVEHAIIVDVEATPARTYDEVASTKTMIDRTEQRLDLKPDWLTADTAYGTGKSPSSSWCQADPALRGRLAS
jgi:Transposase DDE domain